jgi:hypothetical protein
MKMKKIIYTSACALLMGAFMLVSSCSKQDDAIHGPSTEAQNNEDIAKKVKSIISRMPQYKVGSVVGKYGVLKLSDKDGGGQITDDAWSFSQPSNGWSYSSPTGTQYSQNTLWVSAGAFGANTGGTVVAGATSLDINYTFCFSADESAFGLNLFSGATFSGVSVVIGVSGDFEALQNAQEGDNLLDYFFGLAFYIVYDSPASGQYEVFSWFDGFDDPEFVDEKSFAFVIDFRNSRLYLSTSGSVNVNGGSMGFNGEYLEISGFGSNFNFNEISANTVTGFGVMGCN